MSDNTETKGRVGPRWVDREDRARHQAIQDMFRDWHPSPEELMASSEKTRPPRRISRVRGLVAEIKQAREAAGLTLAGLSRRCGIDQRAFRAGKRAQPETDARHALAIRRSHRAAHGPDHRGDPQHAAGTRRAESRGPKGPRSR